MNEDNIVGENVIVIPIVKSIEDKLDMDLEFGLKIIKDFLLDNRKINNISEVDSISLSIKFDKIEKLARLGDIKTIKVLMLNLEVDEIFTQERKDKYLLAIQEHLDLR
jgi:hypothetical protein